MAEKSNQVTRDLQRRINLLVRETLKDIRTEALDEFDRNFEREAFFNEKWTRRKFNDDKSRGLLVHRIFYVCHSNFCHYDYKL